MNVETLVVGDLFTNCYILDPEAKEALVVDPGADARSIVQALRGKGFHLRYIVATHAHFDHVCGMKELQDSLGRGDPPASCRPPATGESPGSGGCLWREDRTDSPHRPLLGRGRPASFGERPFPGPPHPRTFPGWNLPDWPWDGICGRCPLCGLHRSNGPAWKQLRDAARFHS